ncbi:MAG TPA: glutathione S-transferase family protein [Pelomicrobium sp.]|nr:glutathione S-transferase family protein [Pelomicrobium sp.]
MTPVLYQFQCSHFCEKARWALDWKGIDYLPKNLVPGPHARTARRLAQRTSVPILRHGEHVIQGSGEIIDFLDAHYPRRRLTPGTTAEAHAAREWERWLDAEIGVLLRLWFYHHALADRGLATRFILQGAPWHGHLLYALAWSRIGKVMRRAMGIDARTARDAEQRVAVALDRLAGALAGRTYLVGKEFSRADLTAAALLSPLVNADEAHLPEPVAEFRAQRATHPMIAWVRQRYATERAPAAGA